MAKKIEALRRSERIRKKLENTTPAEIGDATTQPTISNCGLLRLPPEIRNYIWQLAVVEYGTITIKPSEPADLLQLPGITQASRQTRAEALPIFLGQNTFHIRPAVASVSETGKSLLFGPLHPHVTQLRHIEISGCSNKDMNCHASLRFADCRSWAGIRLSTFNDGREVVEHRAEVLCDPTKCVAAKVEDFKTHRPANEMMAEDLFELARIAAERRMYED